MCRRGRGRLLRRRLSQAVAAAGGKYIVIYNVVYEYMYCRYYVCSYMFAYMSETMYLYIYIYTYMCVCIYIYIYIYTVSCHNFKSQDFKLSVSNPKSKCVVYLSVLSQISNCQGLGRKNKHEN